MGFLDEIGLVVRIGPVVGIGLFGETGLVVSLTHTMHTRFKILKNQRDIIQKRDHLGHKNMGQLLFHTDMKFQNPSFYHSKVVFFFDLPKDD